MSRISFEPFEEWPPLEALGLQVQPQVLSPRIPKKGNHPLIFRAPRDQPSHRRETLASRKTRLAEELSGPVGIERQTKIGRVGRQPRRDESSQCRHALTLQGVPDQSLLVYGTGKSLPHPHIVERWLIVAEAEIEGDRSMDRDQIVTVPRSRPADRSWIGVEHGHGIYVTSCIRF